MFIMDCLKVIFVSALLCASFLPGDCITGGKEAEAHSRPYMASLQLQDKHECGAFLISTQWLMTAAHCFMDNPTFKVVLGAHSLSKEEDTKQTFDIAAVYNHPDFNKEDYDNDIALIKLSQPVTETEAVKPLKFSRAGDSDPEEGVSVDTAGWGSNYLGRRLDELQEVTVVVMERYLCGRSDYYGATFTSNMICAAKGRMDTCDGDSGGPLLYKGIAVGITSNGAKRCGSRKKPGLYTIISHYDAWITRTMTQYQPVTKTKAVKPLKFSRAGDSDPEEGVSVDTAGWGSNYLGRRLDELQEVTVVVMERYLCGRSDYYGATFTSNMICAAKGRMDTCDGNSGGPLLYKGIAVGITSNGAKRCGSRKKPGLYTIISHYDAWITRTMTQ